MKSEQEFLKGMWHKIDEYESIESQKQVARQQTRQLVRQHLLVVLSILGAVIGLVALCFITQIKYEGLMYVAAFIILLSTFAIDSFHSSQINGGTHK